MTTQAQIPTANRILRELDSINQALIVIAAPGANVVVEILAPGMAGARVPITVDLVDLTTRLTNLRTNLQNQLTALGVTP